MNDYDYLNARLRGMSTRLLTRDFYERVLAAFTDTLLTNALLATPYADAVRQAMDGRGSSPVHRVIEAAVSAHARATFTRILSLAPPEPRRLLALLLNRWDAANVLTLVRARLAGVSPAEARDALLPIGELEEGQLAELAAEKDLDSLADGLTAWGNGFAFPLRRLLLERDRQEDPRSLEVAVTRTYFTWALGELRESDRQQATMRDCIRMLADLANLSVLLGRVRDSWEPPELPPGIAEASAVFGGTERWEPIAPGTLPQRVLREIVECDTLEQAFEVLMETYFAPGIEKGILAYGQAQSLSAMERFLEEVVLERGCRLFRQDMLGVAVPIGFIWREYCELSNLRALARGTAYRMPAAAIRRELVIV
jgi:vacuolar-type H+-ATPase subunit C/Vma6